MDNKLRLLIEQFISGDDTSIASANAIEVTLDDQFPEDDFLQQTVEMLAMYRPEGGDFLFDTEAIKMRLAETAKYMETLV